MSSVEALPPVTPNSQGWKYIRMTYVLSINFFLDLIVT